MHKPTTTADIPQSLDALVMRVFPVMERCTSPYAQTLAIVRALQAEGWGPQPQVDAVALAQSHTVTGSEHGRPIGTDEIECRKAMIRASESDAQPAPAPARVSAGLSAGASDTIRHALEVHEMMTRANAEPCSVGLDMEELLAIDRARAELAALTVNP